MTPFQRHIFSSKTADNSKKDIWVFPDNSNSTINLFTIGTNLDKVVVNWGDNTKTIANNYENLKHTY